MRKGGNRTSGLRFARTEGIARYAFSVTRVFANPVEKGGNCRRQFFNRFG